MKFLLTSSVFEDPHDYQPLWLCLDATSRGHRVLLNYEEKDIEQTFDTWAETAINGNQYSDMKIALEAGMRDEVAHPSRSTLYVCSDVPGTSKTKVTVQDAREIAGQPFRLFTEGPQVDRDFLLSFAMDDEREWFERMLKMRRLERVSCGGVSLIVGELDERLDSGMRPEQAFVVLDSDALVPSRPSNPCKKVAKACKKRRVAHKMLDRRMIENYLPIPALRRWSFESNVSPKVRNERTLKVDALKALSVSGRSHYNFKEGFDRDAKRLSLEKPSVKTAVATQYNGISQEHRTALAKGISKKIAGIFKTHVKASDLQSDGAWLEGRGIILELLGAMR